MASIADSAPNGSPLSQPLTNPAHGTIELADLLWGAPGNNPARPVLMAALRLDANAADFLAGCIYWQLVMGGPFYKFNQPCSHEDYRTGDSWREELGMGETAFARARAQVATKNIKGHNLTGTLASTATSALVIFWTESDRTTTYNVRLDLLCAKLSAALNLKIVAHKRPPKVPHLKDVSAAASSTGPDLVGVDNDLPNEVPAPPVVAPVPRPSQLRKHDLPMKTALSRVTSSITFLKKEEGRKEEFESSVIHIADRLQTEGVWEIPALAIARRAWNAGLDAAATVELYLAHLDHVRATTHGKKGHERVAMAVERMKSWPLTKPAPVVSRWSSLARLFDNMPGGTLHTVPTGDGASALQAEVPGTVQDSFSEAEALRRPATDPDVPMRTLWDDVLGDLQLQMTRATFDAWLHQTRLVQDGESYIVTTPSPYAVEWLENRLRRTVKQTLERHVGTPIQLHFERRSDAA